MGYSYKCPRCGKYCCPSIYMDTCTACANAIRLGHPDPLGEESPNTTEQDEG